MSNFVIFISVISVISIYSFYKLNKYVAKYTQIQKDVQRKKSLTHLIEVLSKNFAIKDEIYILTRKFGNFRNIPGLSPAQIDAIFEFMMFTGSDEDGEIEIDFSRGNCFPANKVYGAFHGKEVKYTKGHSIEFDTNFGICKLSIDDLVFPAWEKMLDDFEIDGLRITLTL